MGHWSFLHLFSYYHSWRKLRFGTRYRCHTLHLYYPHEVRAKEMVLFQYCHPHHLRYLLCYQRIGSRKHIPPNYGSGPTKHHRGIFMAIGKSFEFLADSFNIVHILVIAILAPVIIRLARASRFKFSHPWICLLLTTLLYSSFFFAHCYAMGSRGPGRVQNIYSYIHLWLICLNIYYLSGAIFRKAEQNAPLSSALVNLLAVSKQKYVHSLQYASYCVMGILILSVTIKQSTTNRTVSLILKGTVLRFDQEMSEREQTLKNSKDKTLALPPLTVKMPSDAFNDITIYPGYWINQGMANYYNKERIVALPSPNTAESPSMLLARCKRDVGPGNLKFVYIK